MPMVPDAGRGEVQQAGRAEAAGADEQDLRLEQLRLALDADLRDQQVAAVALLLLRRSAATARPRLAVRPSSPGSRPPSRRRRRSPSRWSVWRRKSERTPPAQ